MATPSTVSAALVEQFIAVTGVDQDVARRLLEACAGNLDMAVGMHMDSGGAGTAGSGRAGAVNDDGNENHVRAPIPQRTEVLVQDDISRLNQFDGALREKRSKKRSLEELYRPPVDITFKGTFQNARDTGSAQNKWLLVNVQNVQEFSCQLLNRDVWSNVEARTIIRDNFIFWQVYNDSEEGKWFMQFYNLTKWPYVAVIDPVTGENQVKWNRIADGKVFCELVKDFLSTCPVPDQSLMSPKIKRLKKEPSILDASEQEQMEAAIQASLVDIRTKINSPEYVLDSDSEADAGGNWDEVETFSDTDEVVMSSPNGALVPTSSTTPVPSRSNILPKYEQLKQPWRLPLSQPSSSSAPSPLSSSNNSSSLDTENHIGRFVSTESWEVRGNGQRDAGPSQPDTWSMTLPSPPERSSPVETNIESSLIDMIGCREAEVGTPDTYTQDDSPSNSQLSVPDRELQGGSQDSRSQSSSQGTINPLTHSSIHAGSSWTDYWGHPSDPVSSIIIRFPDNSRQQVELPCTSQLKALTVYCSGQGFPANKYELVTNYPRRKLSEMASSISLQEAGLHLQETVFVQDL